MLISNLGALGLDKKKTPAKAPVRPPAPVQPPNLISQAIADAFRPTQPLLANKGTGEKDLNFENENGEIRRGSPKGPKVYKFTASLANGMDIDFESDRDLTDDEIQGVVNEYSKTPSYKKQLAIKQKERAAAAKVPTSQLGPMDNEAVARHYQDRYEQMMGPNGLAIAKQMTPAQIADLPIEVQKSLNQRAIKAKIATGELRPNGQPVDTGFDLSLQGLGDSFRRINEAISNAIEQGVIAGSQGVSRLIGQEPATTEFIKNAGPTRFAKGIASAGQYFIPGVGPVVGLAGAGQIATGLATDPQGTVKGLAEGLNVFDPKIDPIERGMRAINVLATIYGGYHAAQGIAKGVRVLDVSKQLGVSKTEALRIVNWAEEASAKAPKRTGINKAGREDAKGTAASIALGNYEPPVAAGRGASNVPLNMRQTPKLGPTPPLKAGSVPVVDPAQAEKVTPPVRGEIKPKVPTLAEIQGGNRLLRKIDDPEYIRHEADDILKRMRPDDPRLDPKSRFFNKQVHDAVASRVYDPELDSLDATTGEMLHEWQQKQPRAGRMNLTQTEAEYLADIRGAYDKKRVPLKKNKYGKWVAAGKPVTFVDIGQGATPDQLRAFFEWYGYEKNSGRSSITLSKYEKLKATQSDLKGGIQQDSELMGNIENRSGDSAGGNEFGDTWVPAHILNKYKAYMRESWKAKEEYGQGGVTARDQKMLELSGKTGKTTNPKAPFDAGANLKTPEPKESFVGKTNEPIQAKVQANPSEMPKPVEVTPGSVGVKPEFTNKNPTSKTSISFTTDPVTIAEAKSKYMGLLAENMQRMDNQDPNLISFRYIDDFSRKVGEKYNVDPNEVAKGMATLRTMHANGMQAEIAQYAKTHGGDYESYFSKNAATRPKTASAPEANVSTKSKLGNPNEKTNQQTIRDVQEGQGIRNEGEQPQGQGNGQKANAFPQEKGQVTPESVGVKSAIEPTPATGGTRTKAPKAEPTPVTPTAGDPNTVAVANADTAESRARMGMEERTKPATEPVASVVETANKTYKPKVVDAKIDRHLGDPKKNILSREDAVQVRRRADELENEYGTAKARLDSAKTADEISAATDDIERIKARHVATINALESTGTETARTLNARRAILNKDDYSFEGLIRSKKAALKRDLTQDEINIEREAANQFKAASADLERVRQEAYAAGRKAAEGELASTIAKERATIAKRAARKPQIQQKRADIMARMKRIGIQDQAEALGTQKLYTLATDIKDLAKTYIEEGVNGLDDLTKKVTADMRANGLDIDDSEFIDVFRGAVKQSPGKDRVLSELQKLKKEANALARERASTPDAKKTAFENRLDARIAEMEKRLEAGDVEVKRRNNPKYDEFQAKELRLKTLQRRVDMERKKLKAQREYEEMADWQKIGRQAEGVAGIPRTIFSSVDVSAPGRQNWFNFVAHPIISAKALAPQFQSFVSRAAYERAAANIRRSPNFDLANNSGLHLSTEALDHGEEMFVNKFLTQAWEIAGKDLNPIAASERAYSGYLSTVRMNLFDLMVNDYKKAGVPITKDIADAIARHVNITTGRGIGNAGEVASKLSAVGFAPRYTVSKFQTVTGNSFRSAIVRKDPVALKRIAKDYIKVLTAAGGGLSLAANYFNSRPDLGVTIETRSNATNFGKAMYKGVAVDLLGGIQEPVRLAAQLYKGKIPASGKDKGKVNNYDRAGTLGFYAMGKLAPGPSLALQIDQGEGFGRNMDVRTAEGQGNLAKRVLFPGTAQTLDELVSNGKLTPQERAVLTLFSAGGLGVNDQSNYKK
ncbi:hypothetical protein EBZ39_05525 [bacterium]|nr:hypothetical protein [bacterium]